MRKDEHQKMWQEFRSSVTEKQLIKISRTRKGEKNELINPEDSDEVCELWH